VKNKTFIFTTALIALSTLGIYAQNVKLTENQSFEIPENWKSRPLGEKDFYIMTRQYTHGTVLETKDGSKQFGEEPFVKDGAYDISISITKDEYCESILKLTNPIIIYRNPRTLSIKNLKTLENFKKDLGKRLLGVKAGEWLSHPYLGNQGKDGVAEVCKIHNVPVPQDRDGAYKLFEAAFTSTFGELQKAGIPVYPFHATFLNHWECRMGASITGVEIGGDERCTPMQLAFTRGASRQYNVPFGTYIACWGGGIKGDSETRYMYVRPDERRIGEKYNADYGPYSGTSLSMQKRFLYVSYMAGANIVKKEGDKYAFFANYDEETVDRINPRVLVLQDRKTYLSPLGRVYKELYDDIVQKHERGIPYTPIALLFDKNHGCILEYSQDFLIAKVPYQKGDYQTRATINTIFPWEDRRNETKSFETNTNVTGPFGDIFDVLTNDASENVISSYKVLFLVGDVRIDESLEKILRRFVENGGTLFMSPEQMTPSLWELAGISDTGEVLKDQRGIACGSGTEIIENKEFKFKKVTLKGAMPVVESQKNQGACLVTLNKVGKGTVMVLIPEWGMVPKSKNQMLNLYSYCVDKVKNEVVPITVKGNVQVLYNKNSKGWVVTLINNNGVYKFPGQKEVTKQEEAAPVTLEPKFKWANANEWLTGQKLSELSIIVPPGDIRIVEIFNK